MIFSLFLGGYLLPKTQHRISELREYIIYSNIIIKQHLQNLLDVNNDIMITSLPNIHDLGNRKDIFEKIYDSVDDKRMLNNYDLHEYTNKLKSIQTAKSNGLTGNYSLDNMIKLYKLLEKHNVLAQLGEITKNIKN